MRIPGVPGDLCRGDDEISISGILSAFVSANPTKTAIICGNRTVSYFEFNALTDGLARLLERSGVCAEDRVGVITTNSVETIIAIFGILKAGGAYVPLDPVHPDAWLQGLIGDLGIRLVVTQRQQVARLTGMDVDPIIVDSDVIDTGAAFGTLRPALMPAQRTAYIMFTSGSGGKPKAVQIAWSSLLNHVRSFWQLTGVSSDDRGVLFSSFAFDGSVEEVFGLLLAGGTLLIHQERTIPLAVLNSLIEEHDLTVLDFSVSYWSVWLDFLSRHGLRIPRNIRKVVIGGETIRARRLALWRELTSDRDIDLVITYGPTEATVIATGMIYPRCADPDLEGIDGLIGRPLCNISVHILDEDLGLLPPGRTGEIYIGGAGVARGYVNDPALTARRFIPDPHSSAPARMYRTGDLGCVLGNGVIQFLGRVDRQVKIRGFRVELEEIERLLCVLPGVGSAMVAAGDENRMLEAFIVPSFGSRIDTASVKSFLDSRFPEYMVPTRVCIVDAFPLGPGGKVDIGALRAMVTGGKAYNGAPTTSIHAYSDDQLVTEIMQLFAGVIGRPTFGADENFFEAGGHSLLALQLLSRISAQLGANVPMRDFFRFPTPVNVARIVRRALAEAGTAPIPRVQRIVVTEEK